MIYGDLCSQARASPVDALRGDDDTVFFKGEKEHCVHRTYVLHQQLSRGMESALHLCCDVVQPRNQDRYFGIVFLNLFGNM